MHAATGEEIEITSQEDREAVASDLLNVLHRLAQHLLSLHRHTC